VLPITFTAPDIIKNNTIYRFGPGPESLDEPLDDEGVAGAGERVHGHAPAAEADTLAQCYKTFSVRNLRFS
jgi:hypothetical protein